MSRNAVSIKHLKLACRHVDEMVRAGVTENHAIRILELFVDVYSKLYKGGSATPHNAHQVKLWSIEAKKLQRKSPKLKPKDCLVVEHGTPRRAFARKVLELYKKKKLTEKSMNKLVNRYWMLAVITIEEDCRLNKIARTKMHASPMERWAAAEIKF